jgi:cell division protein ZapA
MSGKKHAVKVTIVDEEYTVRSELDPEYTRQVAAYVDQAIRRVLHAGPMVETHKAAILAALAITDELFEARKGAQETAARIRDMTGDIARLLPPQKRQSVGG